MSQSPNSHSANLWKDHRLWGIMAFALILGLFSVWPYFHEITPRFKADDLCYHNLAKTLLEGGGFASTYRPPGYPVFVVLVYAVCGSHPFAVYVAQILLFVLSLGLIAAIFNYITGSRSIALTAAVACALYPFYYMEMLPALLTETLALFEIALFLYIMQRALARQSGVTTCILGVVFSAACLTKPVLLPFVVITGLCLVFLPADRLVGLRNSLVFLLVVACCIAPWTYRNWRLTGAVIPVATGSGVNFWIGNYPGNYDVRLSAPNRDPFWPQLPPDLGVAVRGMTEVQRDQYLNGIAMGYIRENPIQAAGIFAQKFSNFWLGYLGAPVSDYSRGRQPLYSIGGRAITRTSILLVPVFIMALIGTLMLRPEQLLRALPLVLLTGWFTLCYVAVVVEGRYAFPVLPYMFGFAVIPFAYIVRILIHRAATKGLT